MSASERCPRQQVAQQTARRRQSDWRADGRAVAVLLLFAAALPSGGHAHGIMTLPASRNWLDYLKNNYYWPDGLSAGGYQVVGQGGAKRWPDGVHGMCGDEAGKPQKFMQPGAVQATYKAGDTVEIHVMITTNHYGRFSFQLCPTNVAKNSDCTPLARADGKGDSWDLPGVAQGRNFNGGALAENLRPMEVNPSYRWYPQPHVDCGYWKYCTRFEGTPVYVLRFKLPKGRKCDRCILRWHYVTGHKCHPPCLKNDPYYPNCKAKPQYQGTYLATMDYCGSQWAANPEQFWNCADIKIV